MGGYEERKCERRRRSGRAPRQGLEASASADVFKAQTLPRPRGRARLVERSDSQLRVADATSCGFLRLVELFKKKQGELI